MALVPTGELQGATVPVRTKKVRIRFELFRTQLNLIKVFKVSLGLRLVNPGVLNLISEPK